jgi:hypothetical protein
MAREAGPRIEKTKTPLHPTYHRIEQRQPGVGAEADQAFAVVRDCRFITAHLMTALRRG